MAIATISTTNSKLGMIHSINLPAGITCRCNAPCSRECYATHGNFAFKSVKDCHLRNLECWQHSPTLYEEVVVEDCATQLYFRWHSSGDIPSRDYLEMMIRVAERCPRTMFLAFTKQTEIVNSYLDDHDGILPNNLTVVFSHWGALFSPHNPYNLPTAHVRFKDPRMNATIPLDAKPCSGACSKCCLCWNLKRGESTVFDKH